MQQVGIRQEQALAYVTSLHFLQSFLNLAGSCFTRLGGHLLELTRD
jgi:hypothetical protein